MDEKNRKILLTKIFAWCNIYFDYVDEYDPIQGLSNPLFYAKHLYLNDELVTNLEMNI